ncbi:MAG: sigma-70 family RNA polymerase sigma factor [Actinomycetota bacterium]|nr:sigma-70 family RNA polymerase sigma factor [Actinomycetota bacterium]
MWATADDALLAGVAVGDSDAMTAFTRRYQARVFGLARTIVGDSAVAEEVAQEAFVRAWRHAPAYDSRRASVATWLLTITRNLAIDAIRARRPQPIDPEILRGLDLTATGHGASPDLSAEASEETTRLRAALAQLPERQRRALVLATMCGRTAREVSEVEGIPLGTAKTRIRAGLQRLREVLADQQQRGAE